MRGLTDNNNLNYHPESVDKDQNEPPSSEIKSSIVKGQYERDDRDRERCLDMERGGIAGDRDCRDRERRSDEQTILDLKDFKERERDRELSTTPVDHSNNKRRRKNSSSNCDNSLTSTHSANIQERHYSQDSQVSFDFYFLYSF